MVQVFTYQCCFPSLSVLFPQHRYTCRKPVQHIKPKGGTYASDKQPVTSLLCFRIVPLQFTICFMFLWNCFSKTGINLMHILLKLFAVGHDKNMKYSRCWSAELPMVFRQPKIKHVELWIPQISWFPGPSHPVSDSCQSERSFIQFSLFSDYMIGISLNYFHAATVFKQ